ncbi:MAG: hypothetical protein AB1473_23370 [Thermodesulfobacteriota bacterium]
MTSSAPITRLALLPAVFCVSGAAVGWQLGLMRCLLISRYHHFSFLVISCALLGFGAGGTLLAVRRKWFLQRASSIFVWGLPIFAISMPLALWLGELLPIDVYFPPMQWGSNLGWWSVFWLVHVVPFLLAGTLVGLALMAQTGEAHLVYATSLVGSAAGSLGTMILMSYLPPNGLAVPLALSVILSCIFLIPVVRHSGMLASGPVLLVVAAALGWLLITPADKSFPLNIDQYKSLADVKRLETQGQAQRTRVLFGPRGRVDLYSSPHFHSLLSLGGTAAPPGMDVVLKDGFQIGTILNIREATEAKVLMGTLAAIPYHLISPRRVLILGEAGSVSLSLAALSPAKEIVLVQPDRNVLRLLRDHPANPLGDPRIRVVEAESRAFLDANRSAFDIIHLAELDGFTPGSGGIAGLREDYLATVEGFRRCLAALAPDGFACSVRGIPDPPRDNIKIVFTWIEALRGRNVHDPGNHLLMARDELGCAILAAGKPIERGTIERFSRLCQSQSWDMEWYPGIEPSETNRVHVLPGPGASRISWYHHALRKLIGTGAEDFAQSWLWNVRPARDDRPFFHDFFRWVSLSQLVAVFGPLWLTRAELGFLVLVLAAGWTALVAFVLISVPVLLDRRGHAVSGTDSRLGAAVYFAALGAGFMFVEMSFIQLFTRFMGEPILAAALVLGGFLSFAGLGSMIQPGLTQRLGGTVFATACLIAGFIVADSLLLPFVFQWAALSSLPVKAALGIGLMAPTALLMGNPFPWGIGRLQERAPGTIPLAWAVNGFASVVSACLAVLMAMAYGFTVLLALAAGLYVAAGLLALRIDRGSDASHTVNC